MATYFIGGESPAASGGGGSSNNYLRNLSQLAESEGRQRYYDHLASQAEQRLGMQEDNDQKAAFLQQELNEHGTPQHATYRKNIGELRDQLGVSLQQLDRAIGFDNSQNNLAGTTSNMRPEDRLSFYRKALETWNPMTTDGEQGISGSKDALMRHWVNASNAVPLLEDFEDAIEKIPGNQSFKNEEGITDYRYIPRDDAIRYYRTKYGKDFETGSPLERAQQPAEEQPTALRAAALAREPQRNNISSPEYITPIRPGGALVPQVPQAVATAGPENVPAPQPAPLGPINYIAPDENDYPDIAPQSLPSPEGFAGNSPTPHFPMGTDFLKRAGSIGRVGAAHVKRADLINELDHARNVVAIREAKGERPFQIDLDAVAEYEAQLRDLMAKNPDIHQPQAHMLMPPSPLQYEPIEYLSTDEPPATGLRRYPPLQREVPLRLDQLQPLRN